MPDNDPEKKIRKPELDDIDEVEDVEEIDDASEEKAASEKHARRPEGAMGEVMAVLRRFSIKTWITIVLSLIALILVLLFLVHPNFRVQEIHISGNKRFSTEQIMELADIKTGDHLYSHVGGSWKQIAKLQYGKVENRIKNSDPYIADAKVYPKYPGEVYIEITERRKVAYVAIPDGYAIISEDSVVLEIETGEVPQGIPEIRGLPIRSAQIGRKLDLTSTEGYDICITVLGAILGSDSASGDQGDGFDFLSHVICVRYCENMTTFIDLEIPNVQQTVSVKIGSLTTISDDMNWLRYAVVSGYFEGKSGTVLDMSGRDYILR
ncbi:MAG: FtsQ-type POTRA domain-containing protein [Clostridiales bacterium]|nr:FtsQ-type POTRA domain-containing protein [Clostridiales bacterium]